MFSMIFKKKKATCLHWGAVKAALYLVKLKILDQSTTMFPLLRQTRESSIWVCSVFTLGIIFWKLWVYLSWCNTEPQCNFLFEMKSSAATCWLEIKVHLECYLKTPIIYFISVEDRFSGKNIFLVLPIVISHSNLCDWELKRFIIIKFKLIYAI